MFSQMLTCFLACVAIAKCTDGANANSIQQDLTPTIHFFKNFLKLRNFLSLIFSFAFLNSFNIYSVFSNSLNQQQIIKVAKIKHKYHIKSSAF